MEGASKKRKYCFLDDDDNDLEEENDEQKMEKFFALIRNIREARDQLVRSNSIHGSDYVIKGIETKKKKNKVVEEDHQKKIITEVWKPSFEPEDFMEEAAGAGAQVIKTVLGSSQIQEGTTMKEADQGKEGVVLDLKLSL